MTTIKYPHVCQANGEFELFDDDKSASFEVVDCCCCGMTVTVAVSVLVVVVVSSVIEILDTSPSPFLFCSRLAAREFPALDVAA